MNSDIRKNCFNLIRLIAALNICVLHTKNHLQIQLGFFLNSFVSCFFAMPVFFGLSGFLIWNSIGKSKNFSGFFKKRIFRLYPELWMSVAVDLLIIIALYGNHIEWGKFAFFAFTQATIFPQWTPSFLRGYGCGTPNGLLDTVTALMQMYILAYFVYPFLHNKKMRIWIALIIVMTAISIVGVKLSDLLPDIIYKLYLATFIPVAWMFIFGAFIMEYFNKIIPYLKKYWLSYLIITILFTDFLKPYDIAARYGVIKSLSIICATLGFGYLFPKLEIKWDISYGIYLYHMLVVNVMINYGLLHKPIYLTAVVLITVFAAILSYVSMGTLGRNLKKKV